jgi:segregation and condensation protein A
MRYEVQTPLFEGPLDLLLKLIEEQELDITKVALAQVTQQFLQHVEAMREDPDIEDIADFLVVAAKLLWIKSRALLPRRKTSEKTATDEDDVGDELIRQLRTYRQYKEAAQQLRERDAADLRSHVRVAPLPRPREVHVDLAGLTAAKLCELAQAAFYPTERPRPEDAIQRPRISVVQQIRLIRRRLKQLSKVGFRSLLGRRPTRLEAVVTLQAILELIKQKAVQAQQSQRFGDIMLEARVPPEELPEPAAPADAV